MAASSGGITVKRQTAETHILTLTPASALRVAIGVFVAFFVLALARNLPDTLARVTLGLILAFALDPVVVRLQQRLGCKRGIAVAIVGSLAMIFASLLIVIVGPRAISQAQSFSRDVPNAINNLSSIPLIGDLLDRAHVNERLHSWAADLPSKIDEEALIRLVENLVGGLVAGVTVIVIGIAALSDGESLVRRSRQLVPQHHRYRADQVARIFYRTIGAYFAGSLLVATLAASFVLTVGLALGVPLAPVAALWVLIVNFIPQIGGFLAASMFTVLGLGKGPGTALLCLGLYVLYMNIENHIIQPAIVGNAINLSTAATMLAALIGGAAAGVPGAVLATPLVGTAKALYVELRRGPQPDIRRRKGLLASAAKLVRNRFARPRQS